MNTTARFLLCLGTGVVLCQCSNAEKKKSKSSELTLAQRATKPDLNKRSRYEQYMTNTQNGKSGTAKHLAGQMHHSKEFSGTNTYAGKKEFKTGQSWFGKSKATGLNQTYALGDKKAAGTGSTFKAGESRFGDMKAGDAGKSFSGASDTFKTRSALTRSQRTGRQPLIIENIEANSTKKSAYSEAEVKRLMGR